MPSMWTGSSWWTRRRAGDEFGHSSLSGALIRLGTNFRCLLFKRCVLPQPLPTAYPDFFCPPEKTVDRRDDVY